MENTLNRNLNMGVDQMKTFLNVKRHNMLASDTSTNMAQTVFSEPEIIATKALLDAVFQSTKEVAGMLKTTQADQLKCNGKVEKHGDAKSAKENGDRKSSFGMDKITSLSRQGVVSKAPQNIFPHGTVTLTLEPVPQSVTHGNYAWKTSPYYTKVDQNPVPLLTNSYIKTNPVCEIDDQSAVNKFQEWHTKYVKELAYANAMNAATSKLKAFAAASRDAETFSKLPSTPSNCVVSTVVAGPKSLQVAESEITPAGQKRKYFTISNHYFQYLNRPKQARHDTLRVIFKAQILLDSDLTAKPSSDTVFPKTFVSWPSGKIPLPGYKTRRPIRRIENFASKKTKRTSTAYRVPKPKANPLLVRQFRYNSISRTPVAPILKNTLQDRRFFPVEKLKWDSAARRYVVHPQQSIAQNKQQNKGQWFSFPSMSKVPGTYSYNITALKKKFGSSGATLSSSSIRSNLHHQNQNRHLPSPVKLRQNIKEIKVIFKCKTPPQPHWFKKFDDYATMCFIYQIRKAMAARAMRHGYIEGKHDNKPKTETDNPVTDDLQIANAASKRLTSNYLVLVSAQTEATFTIWSEQLPRAKELDEIFNAATKSGNNSLTVSSDWVHVCKSGLVEDPQRKEIKELPISHENKKLFEDATNAWLYDTLSDPEEPINPAKTSVTRHTGEPSYTVPSQVGLQSFYNSDSSKSSRNSCNGVVHSKADRPACSGHGRMQRSLSENISSNQQNFNIQKQNHVLPRPSYCVRFRMCFCACDCTCLMRNRYLESNFVLHQYYEKVNVAPTIRMENSTHHCLDSSPDSFSNGDDEFYDFSEKSDVPSIVLKSPSPSKWDEQNRRIPIKSVAEIKKSCPKWRRYFHKKGTFVKKIGSTEIYHKWAVRRCSAPEFDSIVEDIDLKRDSQKIGHTKMVHRLPAKMVSPEKSPQIEDCNHGDMEASFSKEAVRRNAVVSPKKQSREEKNGESALSDPTEDDMDYVFEVVEEVLIDAEKCDQFFLPQSKFCQGSGASNEEDKRKTVTYLLNCKDAVKREAPLSKETLYDVGEQPCSSAAGCESEVPVTAYLGIDNVSRNQTDNEKQCGIPMIDLPRRQLHMSDISSSHTGLVQEAIADPADKVCRHIANLIGQDGSKHKQHVHDSPDKQSLDVGLPCCGGVAATGNGSFTVDTEEMGNTFFKPKDECRVSPVLKTSFTRTFGAEAKEKVRPVLANGFKDIERVDHKILANVDDCEQNKVGDCKQNKVGGCNQKLGARSGFNEQVGYNAVIDDTPIAEGASCEQNNLSIVSCDTERKIGSDSLGLRTTDDADGESYKPTRTLKRTRNEAELEDKKNDFPAESKNSSFTGDEDSTVRVLNADDEVVFAKDKHVAKKQASKTEIASGGVEIDLPVETRSSRRIRSRVNNKRGRYESDYVSDLPKANKKPKRVLPTREYDNDDFWQFYRDSEKTVYSKNLILQNKYIKLLKKKGIKSPISETQTSLFSNVVCASSSLPTQSQASCVTDDGLVPFMSRLTKHRKTLPELPQVPEEHCVYCGRSFIGEDTRSFETHVARHGLRHTMLAAPQMAKKKKSTTRNGRGNFIFKRPKPSNKMVVVVDPPKNKTEAHMEATVSKTSEQLGPLPRPSHLSMGHRKQTARKSFSLASTLPKNRLIAALECKMRAQSTINPDKTKPIPVKPAAGTEKFLPMSLTKLSPSKSVAMQSCVSNSRLPKPHSARKTLTGLPITYSHLNRSYIHAITSLTKSSR